MKLGIHVREPLGNMVYFPQIISDHIYIYITYNKQIIMSMKNGVLRDLKKTIKTSNIILIAHHKQYVAVYIC